MKFLCIKIAFIFFLIFNTSSAQVINGIWKSESDLGGHIAKSVKQTTDGGYIILGTKVNLIPGRKDIYILKLNESFEQLWSKNIVGDGNYFGNSLELTPDGGFIIVGTYESFDTGIKKVYVLRMNADGDIQWSKTVGVTEFDQEGESIKFLSNGSYIITGSIKTSENGFDIYVVKLDIDGSVEWTKTIGGADDDKAFSVDVAHDGGYIIGGWTSSFGIRRTSGYALKLDDSGNLEWSILLNDTWENKFKAVKAASDGGYVLVGETFFGGGGRDGLMVKLNSQGSLEWSKSFGRENNEFFYSVIQRQNGNIVAVGVHGYGGIFVAETTLTGDILAAHAYWNQRYQIAYDVDLTRDGGFILVGKQIFNQGNSEEIFIMKTEPDFKTCFSSINRFDNVAGLDLTIGSNEIIGSGGIDRPAAIVEGEGIGIVEICKLLNIDEKDRKKTLYIYPNPASDSFKIQSDVNLLRVDIISPLGNIIFSVKLQNKDAIIPLTDFSTGIYFIKIYSEEGLTTERIMVQAIY